MLSLLRLERKQTNASNPFRIRIFRFLSYSFGIETINTFIHSRSSPENHTRFQTKLGKNPTRWGGTFLYSLYKGVLPSNGSLLHWSFLSSFPSCYHRSPRANFFFFSKQRRKQWYSRSSPFDHSRKRPALVTTTIVKSRLRRLSCDDF